MSVQPDLWGHTPEPNTPRLGDRQQLVLQLLEHHPDGLTADEVGAHIHHHRGKHTPDERCDYCAQEGNNVLRSKALKPLVTRRRGSGRWQLRTVPAEPAGPGSQTSEIPF